MPGKHGMAALMLQINEAEIKSGAIPVHTHQGQTSTKHTKDKSEPPLEIVHVGNINETTTIFLPTE